MPAPRTPLLISSVDFARSSASGIVDVAPSGDAPRPVGFSAEARDCIGDMLRPIHAPLWEIARWNSPFASGDPTRPAASAAPADSPKMVTFAGSPPKAAMFFCTQVSAATESRTAWLPDALWPDSFVSSGCEKNPNGPSR